MIAASVPTAPPHADLPAAACQRLGLVRFLLVAVEGALLLLSQLPGLLRLPLAAMALVLGLQLALALLLAWRAPRLGGVPAAEAFTHLLADAAAIATLVYLSGGYANPFISLLLVPLLLAATLLPARLIWAMTGAVALAYTLLMRYYQPLALDMTGAEAVNLHLLGMWLNFLITAGLIALFVARLTAALRARDLALAEARERALRDERLFTLGMQAAAAAHDLATPLATLGLTLDELAQTYAGDDELLPELNAMTQQVARMRDVLAALRRAAQADGGTGAQPRPAPVWLAELLQHWRDLRATGSVELLREGRGEPPVLGDEPLLNAALVTLLNNAADAAQGPVTVRLDWDARNLDLEVLDRGPGLSASVAKPEGWGVGLLLARTAVEHLGGSLRLAPREGGGLRAWLRLPLPLARTG